MKQSPFKNYEIEIFQLQNKQYEYSFFADTSFFEKYESSLTQRGEVRVDVTLNKNNEMFMVDMKLNGWIELICDRSLEPYQMNVNSVEKFIYKYSDDEGELSDGLFGLRNGSLTINMATHIYEGIAIQIPFKKIHPRFLEQEKNEIEVDSLLEEGSLIYSSIDEVKSNDETEDIDPRWSKLLKLKNNNN